MGATVLRKVQFGTEATAGTAVAATTVMRWPRDGAVMIDEGIVELVEDEATGQRFGKGRHYRPNTAAMIEVPTHPATFEQIGYWFQAGVERVGTPATDTGGSGKIWQHDVSNTSAATLEYYTIEGGNTQESDEMEYAFVETFTLAGARNESVTVEGTWRGRQLTDCAFTAGQTAPTVEEILFNKGILTMDAAGGTIGTTAKTASWLGFSLAVPTGYLPLFAADGSLYFTSPIWSPTDAPTVSLTMRHNANGEALRAAAQAGTVQLIRMSFTGSAFTTAGSSYIYKTLQINMAGVPTNVPGLEEDDGDDTMTFEYNIVDSDSTQLQFINVNTLAALP